MKRRRFTREDWLNFGLEQLSAKGPDALKLTTLCEAANKTIGSFYHHFEAQPAYFKAMLEHWKDKNTNALIEEAEAFAESDQKAIELERMAISLDRATELGVRAFSHQNRMAAEIVAEVDQTRISYVSELYQNRFKLTPDVARALAELEYAAYVGSQTLWPLGTREKSESLSSLFQELVAARFGKSD